MLGPYIESRGTRGTEMSANADLITVETYHDMYNKGKQFENQFFIYWQKCKINYIWGYLGGPEGIFNDQTGPVLLSSYPLTHIYVHVKYGNDLIRIF